MKIRGRHPIHARKRSRAFTLVEMMVGVGVGSLVLASVAALTIYTSRSFVVMGNYEDLEIKSRNAVDAIGREIRDSSALLAFQTNLPISSLTLTNALAAYSAVITYNSTNRTLVLQKTGQPAQTLLTQCDQWNFALYDRAPITNSFSTNILFYSATNSLGQLDPTFCKLINMSWSCSRQILSVKLTTESVQTAEVVLRNKVN
jgi:Prokaryotic N-terminal methylation motif